MIPREVVRQAIEQEGFKVETLTTSGMTWLTWGRPFTGRASRDGEEYEVSGTWTPGAPVVFDATVL